MGARTFDGEVPLRSRFGNVLTRRLMQALIGQGVLALPAGPTVLRLLPPLVITREQIDSVVETIARVLPSASNAS